MCSVHNAVEFEKRGIPSTVVITSAFRTTVEHQFIGKGNPGHPYVQVPHPVYYLDREEMTTVAGKCVDEVAKQLTS